MDERRVIGCEQYLYDNKMYCCLHECVLVQECPEPICATEFPGGIKAYQRFKKMQEILNSGADLNEAIKILKITRWTAKYLIWKARFISASVPAVHNIKKTPVSIRR